MLVEVSVWMGDRGRSSNFITYKKLYFQRNYHYLIEISVMLNKSGLNAVTSFLSYCDAFASSFYPSSVTTLQISVILSIICGNFKNNYSAKD
jgi:hypothetical protein